jgi:hypothetical protein
MGPRAIRQPSGPLKQGVQPQDRRFLRGGFSASSSSNTPATTSIKDVRLRKIGERPTPRP